MGDIKSPPHDVPPRREDAFVVRSQSVLIVFSSPNLSVVEKMPNIAVI